MAPEDKCEELGAKPLGVCVGVVVRVGGLYGSG